MSDLIEEMGGADLGALLSSALSDPETIAKLREIISNMSADRNGANPPPDADNSSDLSDGNATNKENHSQNDGSSSTNQNHDFEDVLSKLPAILSGSSSSNLGGSIADKQQIALLLAIRPYLSDRRKELIDTFVKINRFGSIFKNLT